MEEIKARAKLRAETIKANKAKAGKSANIAGFQYNYATAKKNLDQAQKDIEDLMAADPGKMVDPETNQPPDANTAYLVRENTLWNKHMGELLKERNGWQAKVNHAVEKGAKPEDMVEAEAHAGADTISKPENPTSNSPDSVLSKFMDYYGYDTTGTAIPDFRKKLQGATPTQAP